MELSHDMEKNAISSQSEKVESKPTAVTKKAKVDEAKADKTIENEAMVEIPKDAASNEDVDEEIEQAKKEEEEAERESKEDKAVAKTL